MPPHDSQPPRTSMTLAEAFASLLAKRQHLPTPPGMLQAREMTTDELKSTWDAFDGVAKEGEPGYFWPDGAPHIEDIHRVLNERGEGYYCAV